jgi:hypothetical protein
MTHSVPLFLAMVFYAALDVDGSVDLLDVVVDPDYWDLLGDDPTA